MGDAIAAIEQWIDQRTPNYVCIRDVHGLMASRKDSRLRDIHNQAGLVTPDGMPLVWMSHWLGASVSSACTVLISCGRSALARRRAVIATSILVEHQG